MNRRALALVLPLIALPACHRRAPAPVAPAPVAAEEPPQPGADEEGEAGERGKRFHAATVYVDGVPAAAFAYNEMPPGVKVYQKEWEPGELYEHFLVCDYLKQLGVDCKDVKETHWYAGRSRVAVITGDELRRNRDKLYFNFTRELFGKPRVEWGHGVRTNDTVDVVSDLAVYVHKKPPRWVTEYWALLDDDGNPIDGIPYLKEEVKGGVRVNLDGRLATRIKRNLLDGNVTPIDTRDGEPRYTLAAFLAAKGLTPERMRGVDLVTRDERVIRLTPEQVRAGLVFAAPRQRRGEVMAYFGDHFAPVAVINVYARLDPPSRPMRTLTIRGVDTAGGAPTSQSATEKTQALR